MSFKILIMLMIFTKIVLNPNIYLRRIVLLKILSPQNYAHYIYLYVFVCFFSLNYLIITVLNYNPYFLVVMARFIARYIMLL